MRTGLSGLHPRSRGSPLSSDGLSEPHTPYMSSRREIPSCRSILYSRHQLLALAWVRDRADRFSVRGPAKPGSLWGREAWIYRDVDNRDVPIPDNQLLLTVLLAGRRVLAKYCRTHLRT